MNRIEKLTAELCPEGVEFKGLQEIATYSRYRIPSSSLSDESYVSR